MPKGARPAEPDASAPSGGELESLARILARAQLRIDTLLHAGRFLEVWRVAAGDGRLLAIKTPVPACCGHPGIGEWLRREYRVLTALDHARVVRAAGFLEDGDRPVLVTEYLGGGDLVSLAGAQPTHWVGAVAAVADALRHVHARGYVHGDVKARNVLFPQAGSRPAAPAEAPAEGGVAEPVGAGARRAEPKLADFGSSVPIGTPLPAETGTAAHRPFRRAPGHGLAVARLEDDVYAFAVLLYELMAGRLPFGADPRGTGPGSATARLGALRSPDAGGCRALERLARWIMTTLRAQASADVGTLTEFADVIESVRAGLVFGAGGEAGSPRVR